MNQLRNRNSIQNRVEETTRSILHPLVVKVLRLTYDFLEENKCFDVQAQYEEDEEGNEYPVEEIEDKENLLYLLNLLKNADHKINREEIKDYRSALKTELY